jgi:hypothetical protein
LANRAADAQTNAAEISTTSPPALIILTPKATAAPRTNGPKVFGVRPGSPFLSIPATGDRLRFNTFATRPSWSSQQPVQDRIFWSWFSSQFEPAVKKPQNIINGKCRLVKV